jgi:hypothetical protein
MTVRSFQEFSHRWLECLQPFHYGNRSAFFKMETHTCRSGRAPSRFSRFDGAAFRSGFHARGDAAAELASFSVFPKSISRS